MTWICNDDEFLKRNAIRFVEDHKNRCGNEECNLSVSMIMVLLLRAGIELTDEEREIFA